MILDRFRLDDKVAVITGCGRGLGAAIAVAFAEAGADVLIASRTESQLEAVAKQVREAGLRAYTVAADLAYPEATAQLAEQAVAAFGRLDIVVNNVGGTMPNTLLTTSTKDLKDAFTFNVATAHALTVVAVPLILEHSCKGSIINITSTMGPAGRARIRRLRHRQGRAVALHPAGRARLVPAHPGERHRAGFDLDLGAGRGGLQRRAAQAYGEGDTHAPSRPIDIAAAAVYLASPAGNFLTGKTLEV